MNLRSSIIRDSVHGLCEIDAALRPVLDTAELQRLRWIRQTGLAYLVFPGAEHSRFSHALGAYSVADRVFGHLRASADDLRGWMPSTLDEDLKRAFKIAALCHDLGHTPLSHLFEPMLLPEGAQGHEDCSLMLLKSSRDISTEINKWCDIDEVIQLLDYKHPVLGLCDLISGDYDVDRWDYLLRDAHATGVRYGTYDLGWMIQSLLMRRNNEGKPIVVLDGHRGAVALQQFLWARRYMYREVYWHRTVRAAELLLRSIYERAMDPKRPGYRDKKEKQLVPFPLQRTLFERKRPSIEEFLAIDDVTIQVTVRAWADGSRDELLSYLSRCFLRRRLPAQIELFAGVRSGSGEPKEETLNRLRQCVRSALKTTLPSTVLNNDGLKYLVLIDRKQFDGGGVENLFFERDGLLKRAEELAKQSEEFRFHHLMEKFEIVRVYVPDDASTDVQRALERRKLK